MRKLSIALLLLATALPLAAKEKTKHKDKRFEPVEMTAAQAVGRYVGIDPDYVVELTATGGTLRREGATTALTHVVIDGSELRAMAGSKPFHATFVNRIKNGETAFGLTVHDANIWINEQMMIQNLFCRRE